MDERQFEKSTCHQGDGGRTLGTLADSRTFDLQFFASAEDEGRTEDPTSKRRNEARSEGQVVRTEELSNALVMGAGFLTIWFYGAWMFWHIQQFALKMMRLQLFQTVNEQNITLVFRSIIWVVVKVTAPITAAAFVAGTVAHLSQVGLLFTLEPLQPSFDFLQFSMPSMLDKLTFSKEVLWKLLLSVTKLLAVGLVALEVISAEYDTILLIITMPLKHGVKLIISLAFEIIWKSLLILLLIAVPDYWFQWYQHEQELKMTPEQKKDEKKQQEGDPEVSKKQQEKMQESMQRRVEEEVPEADVVITNPTHYAVALSYDELQMEAPMIVAKGEGMLAQRIKQLAEENGVPIYEVPLLARTLCQLELDQEIPPVLYDAVATVLAWVERNRTDVDRNETAQLEQKVAELDIADET